MAQTIREQAKRGVRVGGGIAAFLVALIPLGDGFRRIWLANIPPQFSFSGFGLVELTLAGAILIVTAHLWLPYFGGCIVLGFLQGLIVLSSGKSLYSHKTLPRLETLGFLLFCGATLALLIRPLMGRTTILDRIALTLYIFSFPWYAMHDYNFSLTYPFMLAGPFLLLTSWCLDRWKRVRAQRTNPRSNLQFRPN